MVKFDFAEQQRQDREMMKDARRKGGLITNQELKPEVERTEKRDIEESNEERYIPVVIEGKFQKFPDGGYQFATEGIGEKIIEKIPCEKFKQSYKEIVSNISDIIAEQAREGSMNIQSVKITLAISAEVGTEGLKPKLGLSTTAGIEVDLIPKK